MSYRGEGGVSPNKPHIYVVSVNFVCVSVFLSVGLYVRNMIIYNVILFTEDVLQF